MTEQALGSVSVLIGGNMAPLEAAFLKAKELATEFEAKMSGGVDKSSSAAFAHLAAEAQKSNAMLAKITSTSAQAAAGIEKIGAAARRGTAPAVDDITKLKQALERYGESGDPVYRMQRRMAEGERLIADAEKAGIEVNAGVRNSLDLYREKLAIVTRQMNKTTGGLRLNRIGMMELQAAGINSFQALAAGMDPFHVAMMESTQVVGAFVQGTEGGLKALGGAVMRFATNPITLMIAAATAGAGAIAYFAGAFDKAGPTIDKITEKVKAFESTVSGIGSDLKLASSGVDEMAAKFGVGAAQARELAMAMANMQIFKAQSQIVNLAADMNGNLKDLVTYYQKFEERSKNVYANEDRQRQNLTEVQREIRKINDEYGLTIVQATKVVEGLKMMQDTSSPEKMAKGALQMAAAMREAQDAGQKIPDKMRDVAIQAAQAAIAALKLQGHMEEAKKLGEVFAGLDLGAGIRGATKDAIELAKKLGISIGLAEKLAKIQSRTPAQNLLAARIKSGSVPNVPSAQAAAGEDVAPTFVVPPHVTMPPNPTKTSKGHTKKTPKVDEFGVFTEQKAYDQVIKDTTSDLKNYQMMIDATQKALDKGAITTAQASRETAMLKEKMLEASDAGKFYAQTIGSFEQSFSQAMTNWSSAKSFLDGLAQSVANLAQQFAAAAAQAALFGTGALSGGGTIAQPSQSLLGGLFSGIASGGGGGGGGGGFLSKLFGFARGTDDAPGGNAMVAENGMELVAGPKVGYLPKGSKVIPNQETAQMIRAPHKMPTPQVHLTNINVLDPSLVGDYMKTAEGEQTVMNIVRRNSPQ